MIQAISIYELYDIYDVFCFLRSHMEENEEFLHDCSAIVGVILHELEVGECFTKTNAIRKKLREAKISMLEQFWPPLCVDNVYTYFGAFIKDQEALSLLVCAIRKLAFFCEQCDYKKIYEWIDFIHFLPIIISEHRKIPRFIKKRIIE